jgi:diacylglycerol kinase (ATP)
MVKRFYFSPNENRRGLWRLYAALGYSLRGVRAAIKHEASFRQELALAVLMIPSAFLLGRSLGEVFILIAVVVLVLVAELINSAIEALADAISEETHPLLGRAKDLGSAAVMLLLFFVAVVWGGVAVNRFLL